MPKLWFKNSLKKLVSKESGFTFIETIVAIAIMSSAGLAFLSGVATTSRVAIISGERVYAEDLAKSQLEYINNQEYIPTDDYDPGSATSSYQLIEIPADLVQGGYSITIEPPSDVTSSAGDYEVQSITIIVNRYDKVILTVSSNKVSGRIL